MTLIRVKPARRHESSASERAIRQLDRGAARLALRHQREGAVTDAYGTAQPLASGLAQGYSSKALERRARSGEHRRIIVSV